MIEIREYRGGDRDAVRQICSDTGFLGNSIKKIIDYTDLFIDLDTNFFLNDKNTCIYVATDNEKVVGYVLLTPDVKRYKKLSTKYYMYRVFLDVIRFRLFRKKEYMYYVRLLIYYLKGEFTLPEFYDYPALLHINVAPGHQEQGIGRMLFDALFACVRKFNCPAVQLKTTSANEKSVGFFKKFGFEELTSKETSFYKPYGLAAVRTIVMGKKFC
jgi:ribosomal protein S18 acetylase RimI-like enzyme